MLYEVITGQGMQFPAGGRRGDPSAVLLVQAHGDLLGQGVDWLDEKTS